MQKGQPHAFVDALARDGAQPYPPEWALSGGYLYREHDEDLVGRLLEGFTPREGRAFVLAKEHKEEVVGKEVLWETEEWYGTRYFVRNMSKELLRKVILTLSLRSYCS